MIVPPREYYRQLPRRQTSSSDWGKTTASADQLTQFGFKPDAARAITAGRDTAEKVAEELERQGVQMLVRDSPGYPARLSRIPMDQAPPVLFAAGNLALLERKAVPFCGARDASEDGL